MISLSINITSTTLTLQSISGNDITLTVGVTTNELSLSIDRGISLETVKADSDIKNAIDNAHIQNSDTILDEGGDNEVTAEECLIAYNHSQSAHAPSYAEKNVQSDWNEVDDSEDDFIKNKPDIPTRDSLGLDTDDSPEFTDTTLKALNTTAETGGEISTTLWAWIQSVYSSIVAKSVKSHITGLWSVLKDHATRIGSLEDRYLLKYVVPSNVTYIELKADKYGNAFNFVDGDEIEISINAKFTSGNGLTNRILVRVNSITSYDFYSTKNFPYIISQGWGLNEQSIYKILIDGIVKGIVHSSLNDSETTSSQSLLAFKSNSNVSNITSIKFYINDSNRSLIDAGSTIMIKRR